ncbi:MAG TPA: hypothetical protein VI790_00085 [Candidatus Nanoarchaeia archaeon]|nr:hypothetical protein [Candidatus Nanoarchaeia archaeon]
MTLIKSVLEEISNLLRDVIEEVETICLRNDITSGIRQSSKKFKSSLDNINSKIKKIE